MFSLWSTYGQVTSQEVQWWLQEKSLVTPGIGSLSVYGTWYNSEPDMQLLNALKFLTLFVVTVFILSLMKSLINSCAYPALGRKDP